MATVQRASMIQYPDGQVVIHNIRKKRVSIPVFGANESYSATLVNTWYDGTAMDDSKADGSIYFKLKALPSGADSSLAQYVGSYFRLNLPNEGELFLEKDTMQEMRNLSSAEILLIQMGYYKGVKLNGYYTKGDTPGPIEYNLSTTSSFDDGGSVIEVGSIKLEHKFAGEINILYFGAVGDNNTDDTLSIQNAFDYASTLSGRSKINVPDGYNFIVEDTVTLDINVNLIMDSPFSYQGPTDRACLVIGRDSARNYHGFYRINVTATNARSDWEDEDESYIGVQMLNFYSATIEIKQASFFTVNVEGRGNDGNGFVYNTILLSDSGHAKKHIKLISRGSGWANQNTIIGGRIQTNSTINRGKNRYGIVLTAENTYLQNNNIVIGTSLELNDESARDVVRDPVTNEIISINNPDGEAVPILIERGRQNVFKEIRDEGNTYTVKVDNNSYANEVNAVFSNVYSTYLRRVREVGQFSGTKFTTNIQLMNQELGWPLLTVPNVLEYLQDYSTTAVYVKTPFRLQNSGSTSPTQSLSGITRQNGYIEIGSGVGLGFRIDTSVRKRFNIALDVVDLAHDGRIYLVIRDSEGNTIEDASNKIQISGRYEIYSTSQFGGGAVLETGVNPTRDLGNIMQFFRLPDEAVTCDVFFSYYQEPMQLKGFQVHSLDGFCAVIPYNDVQNKFRSVAPTTPTFNGDFVISTNPAQIGWVQKVNTWREIGGMATPTVPGVVNRAVATGDILTGDLTSLSATEVSEVVTYINSMFPLVNELKAKINRMLETEREAGQRTE